MTMTQPLASPSSADLLQAMNRPSLIVTRRGDVIAVAPGVSVAPRDVDQVRVRVTETGIDVLTSDGLAGPPSVSQADALDVTEEGRQALADLRRRRISGLKVPLLMKVAGVLKALQVRLE